MTAQTAIFCLLIVGSSLTGGLLPLATKLTHTRLQVYLSFSAGVMLGAAFCHMLPEAVQMGSASTLRWTAAGFLGLFLLERFFAFHHHESPADPHEPCPSEHHEHGDGGRAHAAGLVTASAPGAAGKATKGSSLVWSVASIGLGVHSLLGGVALASAAIADSNLELAVRPALWSVFLATFLHKPADALTIVSLMMRSGMSKTSAHIVNIGFSLLIPLGAALHMALWRGSSAAESSAFGGAVLAFSAGTFLCIALGDLLPELQFHSHDRLKLSLALTAGFGVMMLL